ncbi:DUF7344 domain-containing protein [Salinilacihabitans rarus]|uniref:DUF7344 domain-containing protein n=1 Tax=Salinilacihabitans rarus TaxID=2961596 RepID=UPI0020C8A076|nr:hypothetical protein [Salinilacihabitans rarus]
MSDDADDRGGDGGANVPRDPPPRPASGGLQVRVDDYLGALAHRRRRLALYYLRRRERATMETLARWIAAVEEDVPVDEVTDADYAPVTVDLFHVHLPKLADARVVEYDGRSGAVRYRDPPAALEELVSTCADVEYDI